MTNSWNTPVEAFEHQYPVRIESYRVRNNSGGAGAHRGGDGMMREFRFLAPAEVTVLSDRRVRGPYGLRGGEAGKPGRNTLLRRGRKAQKPSGEDAVRDRGGRCASHRNAGRGRVGENANASLATFDALLILGGFEQDGAGVER